MAELPTPEFLRSWVNVPAEYLPEDQLDLMYRAALGKVSTTCRVPLDEDGNTDTTSAAWPDELVEAILRRVQREIAAKNLPLGYLDQASEYGPARIPAYDVLIEELEGHHRKVVV